MTINNNKGKTGPSTIHPNIPQGGRPGASDPPASKVMVGTGNPGMGTKGRKSNT